MYKSDCLFFSQNPSPGVATYLPLMDNSVITFDHFLKPLPAFPTAKYPLSRLDKTVNTIIFMSYNY